jgi:dihydropteroate synthase
MKLLARGHVLALDRPQIMGIVNLGADSFSGDGIPETDAAFRKSVLLVHDGADWIDVGAESARTNRAAISEEEEADQLLRFISRWQAEPPQTPEGLAVPLSINTWRPGVARRVLPHGGDLLNDIGALPTDENARICADTGAALLIMHSVGEPKIAHTHVGYDDIMLRLDEFFSEKLAAAERAGMPREGLVIDPGIDFAKQREDNLRIYRDLERLHRFDRPILLPVSRKTVIGDVLGLPPSERDAGTLACLVAGLRRGAHIFRVHNVRAAAQAVRTVAPLVAGCR